MGGKKKEQEKKPIKYATCKGIKEFNIEPHEVNFALLTRIGLCMYHRGMKTGSDRQKKMDRHILS